MLIMLILSILMRYRLYHTMVIHVYIYQTQYLGLPPPGAGFLLSP